MSLENDSAYPVVVDAEAEGPPVKEEVVRKEPMEGVPRPGVEVIGEDDLVDKSTGQVISLEQYMARRAVQRTAGDFGFFDGASPFVYPRLNLSDEARAKFLEGLEPAFDTIVEKYTDDAPPAVHAEEDDTAAGTEPSSSKRGSRKR